MQPLTSPLHPPTHPKTGKDGRNQVEAKKQAIFEEERGRLAAVEAAKIRQNEVQRALRAAQFKKDAEIRLQKAGEEASSVKSLPYKMFLNVESEEIKNRHTGEVTCPVTVDYLSEISAPVVSVKCTVEGPKPELAGTAGFRGFFESYVKLDISHLRVRPKAPPPPPPPGAVLTKAADGSMSWDGFTIGACRMPLPPCSCRACKVRQASMCEAHTRASSPLSPPFP